MYRESGVHGIMIENMHDTPYLRGAVGPEIVAVMSVMARAVKDVSRLPCGVQVLAGANTEAVAVAHAARLDFVRVEGFAFAHIADEGFIQSSAAPLLRYRKQIGADHVQVWADVKKKHSSHAITADISVGETAEAVEMMRGDAVIITGTVTGDPPSLPDIRDAKKHCPVTGLSRLGRNGAESGESTMRRLTGLSSARTSRWTACGQTPWIRKRVARFIAVHTRLGS